MLPPGAPPRRRVETARVPSSKGGWPHDRAPGRRLFGYDLSALAAWASLASSAIKTQ